MQPVLYLYYKERTSSDICSAGCFASIPGQRKQVISTQRKSISGSLGFRKKSRAGHLLPGPMSNGKQPKSCGFGSSETVRKDCPRSYIIAAFFSFPSHGVSSSLFRTDCTPQEVRYAFPIRSGAASSVNRAARYLPAEFPGGHPDRPLSWLY